MEQLPTGDDAAIRPLDEKQADEDDVVLIPGQRDRRSRKRSGQLPLLVLLAAAVSAAVAFIVFFTIRVHSGPPMYRNPVVATDAPEPGVLVHDGRFFVVTASGTIGKAQDAFPIRCSENLVNWEVCGHVFPGNAHPPWTKGVDLVAPELRILDGRFVVYYAARDDPSDQMAIGVATSDQPAGPYSDLGRPMLLDKMVGQRDPHLFSTSAGNYLLWKVDGEQSNPPQRARIVMQAVSSDGKKLLGYQTLLLEPSLEFEEGSVGAPWVVEHEHEHTAYYYLFYSAGDSTSQSYSVSVARSDSIARPFVKLGTPLLSAGANSTNRWAGPGHCSIASMVDASNPTVPPSLFMLYSAFDRRFVGDGMPRPMLVDKVMWRMGWPRVASGEPTQDKQEMP